MSPATENKDKIDEIGSDSAKLRAYTNANGASSSSNGAADNENTEASTSMRQEIIATGLSYAVAIYPYMAEQDDEFDVVVYVFFPSFFIHLHRFSPFSGVLS